MAGKRKSNGRAVSMPAGVGIGILISMVIMIIGAAVLTFLIASGKIPEDGYGFGVMLTQFLAAGLGALTAMVLVKHRKLMVCGLTAGGYFLALLSICALFFGGEYTGIGTTFVLVLAGGAAAAVLSLREQKSSGKRRKMAAYR